MIVSMRRGFGDAMASDPAARLLTPAEISQLTDAIAALGHKVSAASVEFLKVQNQSSSPLQSRYLGISNEIDDNMHSLQQTALELLSNQTISGQAPTAGQAQGLYGAMARVAGLYPELIDEYRATTYGSLISNALLGVGADLTAMIAQFNAAMAALAQGLIAIIKGIGSTASTVGYLLPVIGLAALAFGGVLFARKQWKKG